MDGVLFDITSEKLSNQAIIQSELKYRRLFENLIDIYLYIDPDGIIKNLSPSLKTSTGLNSTNMLNKHISLTLNNNYEKNAEFINTFKNITTSYIYTISFKNFIDRTPKYFSLKLQADHDQYGNIIGYEGIARDITKDLVHNNIVSTLFDISAAVNESQSLDSLYKYIHKAVGKVVFANNFFIALVNKELNSIYFPYFVDEVDISFDGSVSLDFLQSKTVELIRSKKPILYKFIPNADEINNSIGTISLSWLGVPLKLGDEVIGAIVVQSYDNIDQFDESDQKFLQAISDQIAVAIDRKNSQIFLDTQLKFISRLVENIPYPLYFKDVKTLKYKLVNEAYANLMNVKKNDLIGKTSLELFKNDRFDKDFDEELLINREPQSFEETMIINGEEKQLLILRNCFYDSEQKLNGIIGVIVDITEQKRANKAIEESLEKEREVNELKNKFISIVSHEFRTPLQSILLSTELLQEYSHKMDFEDKKNQYDRIKKSISSLNLLMDDVLLINKSERGLIHFNPEFNDIAKLIIEMVNSMKILSKNNVTVKLNINTESAMVMVDDSLVSLVLSNLISNAIKYSKPNTTVSIEAFVSDENTKVSITDQGIGIPKSEQAQIFKPFYRSSNVGNVAGTGLGLSIVYDTVMKFKGEINFVSEENVGTTFNVVIPYAD